MATKRPSPPLPTLPADPVQAMRHAYQRIQRLERLKGQCSERVRAELKAAKDETDIAPGSIREAARLGRMTPERRLKWENKLNGALGLLGYSQIVLESNPPMGNAAAVRKTEIERLEAEKREYSDEIALLYRAAMTAGLDVASLRVFVRMGRQCDAIEIGEWFDGIDQAGKALGVWEGALDVLHA